MRVERKLANTPFAQGDREPLPRKERVMEDDEDETIPVKVTLKPPKHQRRDSETDTAWLALLSEIKEGPVRTESRLTPLEYSSASRDVIQSLVKKAKGGLRDRPSKTQSLSTKQNVSGTE